MNEYNKIRLAMNVKLDKIGKRKADLARVLGISQQSLCNYCAGMNPTITPNKLKEMINEGIAKL